MASAHVWRPTWLCGDETGGNRRVLHHQNQQVPLSVPSYNKATFTQMFLHHQTSTSKGSEDLHLLQQETISFVSMLNWSTDLKDYKHFCGLYGQKCTTVPQHLCDWCLTTPDILLWTLSKSHDDPKLFFIILKSIIHRWHDDQPSDKYKEQQCVKSKPSQLRFRPATNEWRTI